MRRFAGSIRLLPGVLVVLSLVGIAPVLASDAHSKTFEKGVDAYRAGNRADARRIWSGLAVRGHTLAQYNLGIINSDVRDYGLALKWFGSAAQSGFAPAFVNLAMMYRNGHGTRKDPEMALAHLVVASAALPPGRCRENAVGLRQAISVSLPAKALLNATRTANTRLRPAESKYSFFAFAGECFESIAVSGGTIGSIAEVAGFRSPGWHAPDRSVAADIATREATTPPAAAPDPIVQPRPAMKPAPAANPTAPRRAVVARRDAGPAPVTGRWTYFAQVASLPTNADAQRFETRLRKRHGAALGGRTMAIQEAQVEKLGTVYRVRIGPFAENADAKDFCRALKEKRQACFVVRQAKKAG